MTQVSLGEQMASQGWFSHSCVASKEKTDNSQVPLSTSLLPSPSIGR